MHRADAQHAALRFYPQPFGDVDGVVVAVSRVDVQENSDANAPQPSGGISYPGMGSPKDQMDPYYIAVTEMLSVQLMLNCCARCPVT
jgi:hypothetical protein